MFCARAQGSDYCAYFRDVGTVGGAADVLHIAGQSVTQMESIFHGSDHLNYACASPEISLNSTSCTVTKPFHIMTMFPVVIVSLGLRIGVN